MENKRYMVSYWGEDGDDARESRLQKRVVLIPDKTKQALIAAARPPFMVFIVDDGQEWYAPTDHIVEIIELWEMVASGTES